MDNGEEMSLAISFPDQSHSFVHGYEAGRIAKRMDDGEQGIDCGCETGFPLHEENLEVIRRMAAYYGYNVEHRDTALGWAFVRLTKTSKPTPQLQLVR